LARNQCAEEPRFGSSLDRFFRETMLAVDLRGVRPDHSLRELAYSGAKPFVFGREFKVQLRR
jgi:hypothetical protein